MDIAEDDEGWRILAGRRGAAERHQLEVADHLDPLAGHPEFGVAGGDRLVLRIDALRLGQGAVGDGAIALVPGETAGRHGGIDHHHRHAGRLRGSELGRPELGLDQHQQIGPHRLENAPLRLQRIERHDEARGVAGNGANARVAGISGGGQDDRQRRIKRQQTLSQQLGDFRFTGGDGVDPDAPAGRRLRQRRVEALAEPGRTALVAVRKA